MKLITTLSFHFVTYFFFFFFFFAFHSFHSYFLFFFFFAFLVLVLLLEEMLARSLVRKRKVTLVYAQCKLPTHPPPGPRGVRPQEQDLVTDGARRASHQTLPQDLDQPHELHTYETPPHIPLSAKASKYPCTDTARRSIYGWGGGGLY